MIDSLASDTQSEPSELEVLEAKRDAMVKAREERARLSSEKRARETLEREISDEEQAAADAAALDMAVEEHGERKVIEVKTDMGSIILRRPENFQILWKAWRATKMKDEDDEKLVRKCLHYPSAARFDEILTALPGTDIMVKNAVFRMAGVRAETLVAK